MSDTVNDTAAILADAATRLFEEHLDEAAVRQGRAGAWLDAAWGAIEAMGLPLALLDEAQGGFGLEPGEALGLVRLAGFHAAPLPIGETMIANRALARAGLPIADGPAAIVPAGDGLVLTREGAGWRLAGTAHRVPWGDAVTVIAAEAQVEGRPVLVRLAAGSWQVAEQGGNIAGHPRPTLAIDAAIPADAVAPFDGDLLADGAAIRAQQLAGALDRVLGLAIEHVEGRVQFGRALSKFQAIQHELAKLAGEVAAAGAAADIAVEALGGAGGDPRLAIAAARVRVGEAAGVAAGIAHQLHGAIGFTAEHRLHLFTTALWSWREEYGGHAYWARTLGKAAFAAGPDGYWPFVTAA